MTGKGMEGWLGRWRKGAWKGGWVNGGKGKSGKWGVKRRQGLTILDFSVFLDFQARETKERQAQKKQKN